jgi:homoserine kinase
VRVPCSTSNLGAGFDCLGLAFDRYLDAGFEPGGDTLAIRRAGTLAQLDIDPHDDILASAFRTELQRRGATLAAGTIMIRSAVPVGYGLGSSGAAAAAGIALAAAACGAGLDRAQALEVATRAEGHPDNAAASLFGGLVAVAADGHGVPRAMRLPLSPEIRWAFAAPAATVATQRARAVLPQQVTHSAAVRNTALMAALLYGLANADGAGIATGFDDELHVPWRLPLIPGGRDAMDAAHAAGAWGCTISGSGSGLLAACPAGAEQRALDAMLDAFRSGAHGGDGFILTPDPHGVQPLDLAALRAQFHD